MSEARPRAPRCAGHEAARSARAGPWQRSEAVVSEVAWVACLCTLARPREAAPPWAEPCMPLGCKHPPRCNTRRGPAPKRALRPVTSRGHSYRRARRVTVKSAGVDRVRVQHSGSAGRARPKCGGWAGGGVGGAQRMWGVGRGSGVRRAILQWWEQQRMLCMLRGWGARVRRGRRDPPGGGVWEVRQWARARARAASDGQSWSGEGVGLGGRERVPPAAREPAARRVPRGRRRAATSKQGISHAGL